MSRLIWPALFAFSAFALAAFSQDNRNASQVATSVETLAEAIKSAAPNTLARHRVPGVGVAFVHDGELAWAGGFGIADTQSGRPATADTTFEIASLTKPVTAWAVLKLAEEGRIELDEPIETYHVGWELPPSEHDHSKVTPRAILAHAAGLSKGGDSGVEPGDKVPTLIKAANGATMDYGAVRVSRVPGAAYHYSSKGYVLLEMAIENITGEQFAHYVEREVLNPLGMKESAFGWSPELEAHAAYGHDWYGHRLPHYRHATKAQGGIVATAADVARFMAASMPDGKGAGPGRGIISDASVRATFTPYPYENDGSAVGLGYNLHTDSDVLVARKGGDHRGFKALLLSMPDIGAGIVILANSDRAAPGVFADIACPWSRAMPTHPMETICSQLYMLRNAHWSVAGILALTGFLMGWRVLLGIHRKSRHISLTVIRTATAAALGLAVVFWWYFWYSDIPLRLQGFPPTFYTVRATLWPTAFIWVSCGVSVFLIALSGLVLVPRQR